MQLDATTVWSDVCEKLRGLVSREIFHLWFERITPVSIDGGVLTLGVPDEFSMIWIQDNYSGFLRDVAVQASQKITGLHYLVQELSSSPQQPTADETKETVALPRPAQANPKSGGTPRIGSAVRQFNPKNVFDTFVIGSCNNLAHAGALAVAQSPGKSYNPLFIYGDTGLGKTHLMQAIGCHVASQKPPGRVVYISCETFINEFIRAIQSHTLVPFRRKYREADVLLIDDVQFLSGKERLQEEFFHTFNALFENRKQIVLSSDRPISEIAGLEKRLVSRFEWGLVTDILPPDYETRLAILRKKLETLTVAMEPQVLEFIAHRIRNNVRRLEGALVRVASYASLSGKPLDLPTVEGLLKDTLRQESAAPLSVEAIQKVVAQHYDLRPSEMTSRHRPRSVAWPRQVAMFLCRRHTQHTLAEIGQKFGGRDHGTVMHACRLVESKLKSSSDLRQAVDVLSRQLLG